MSSEDIGEDEDAFATFDVGNGEDDLAAAEAAAAAEFGEDESVHGVAVEPEEMLPVAAIVGRPNVGKSTLVNRILGRRAAVVEDIPGVTRDRVRYESEWAGTKFWLIDTGGWDLHSQGLASQVSEQARRAAVDADVVVLVVDATVGITDGDAEAVKMLRKSGTPVLLVANKVDSALLESEAASLWSLGAGEPISVSALHGRGSGDLLEALVKSFPEHGSGRAHEAGPPRVALLGRPNVGKSSLLNKLAGSQRSVVDSVAGTTVDPVDELVDIAGKTWRFVDTAGIRRRVKTASGPEWYASLRTQSALERSEVCIVLFDASEELSEQDVRIVSKVVDSGRALVLAMNKWDLVDEDRRYMLDREYDRDLHHVDWAPRVNISATTGRHLDRLTVALEAALDGWHTRVSTGRLNQFLKDIVAAHPHPIRGGKQPRILFGTQASVAPPTFVLFTTGFLEANYRRFIERRLREEFGFEGSPIRVDMRIRAKRKRRK
ncbi:MAG: ribosome biogenesis GTPase Der [Actinobacteria bacterium]|nr:ribosome biogenesis GTPase Der [Actinomycetota bacterium]